MAVTPFKSLQHLTFEGDEITPQVAKFLLRHSSQLETFHLALSLYDQAAKGEQDCWHNPGLFHRLLPNTNKWICRILQFMKNSFSLETVS